MNTEKTIEAIHGVLINVSIITVVLILGYIFPQLSWHYEVLCHLHRNFADAFINFLIIYGIGLMGMGIITAMFWKVDAGIVSFLCGFLFIASFLMFLFFGGYRFCIVTQICKKL